VNTFRKIIKFYANTEHIERALDIIFIYAGTHWVWEIITMILKGKAEYEKRPKEVYMLEFQPVEKLSEEKRPRIFNTHLFPNEVPTASLEGKGKSLFLVRNPKDVVVSYYHHLRNMKIADSPISWNDYMHLVINYGGKEHSISLYILFVKKM
jgi:hypothetical protein